MSSNYQIHCIKITNYKIKRNIKISIIIKINENNNIYY